MWRLAIRNLSGRKGRLALTALAIVAGTAFLGGVLIFTATLQRSFAEVFAKAYANTDVLVRSSNVIDGRFDELRDSLPIEVLDTIRRIDGVRSASPLISEPVTIAAPDNGGPIQSETRFSFGEAWDPGPTSTWRITQGRAPEVPGEAAVDLATAREADISIGDSLSVRLGNGAANVTIVGFATFGDAPTRGRSAFALLSFADAQRLLIGDDDTVSAIVIAGDGSRSDEALAAEIQSALTRDYTDVEAITGDAATLGERSSVERGLEFFSFFLTTFALISLFVSSFVIYNVFSVAQTQRAREHALLRAIGAGAAQLTRVLLAEAAIVGVIGSAVGFASGIGVAYGLTALLPALGVNLTAMTMRVEPAAMLTVVLTGTVVTVLCAMLPALRSGRVPPLAAVREHTLEPRGISRTRIAAAAGLLSTSMLLAIANGKGGGVIALAGAVAALYIGLAVISPALVGPTARIARRPLRRMGGVSGAMAAQNSARNPRRTALTSSALMIGLSLMIAISTMGSSIRASTQRYITDQVRGDLVVSAADRRGSFGSIPGSVTAQIAQLPEVDSAAGIGATFLAIEGPRGFEARTLLVIEPVAFGKVVDLSMVTGQLTDLDQRGVVMSRSRAERGDVSVGDTVRVQLAEGTTIALTVRGTYESDLFRGSFIVSRAFVDSLNISVLDAQVFVLLRDDVTPVDGAIRIAAAVDNETLTVRTPKQLAVDENQELEGRLNFVYGLLGMSILIATLGITITLVLSIHERRREISLLRAVGMTRRQMRSTVRWESVIMSLLGAGLGVVSGFAVGWLVVRSLRSRGLDEFAVELRPIAMFIVLSVTLGIIAAVIPARRAARSDILSGIAVG